MQVSMGPMELQGGRCWVRANWRICWMDQNMFSLMRIKMAIGCSWVTFLGSKLSFSSLDLWLFWFVNLLMLIKWWCYFLFSRYFSTYGAFICPEIYYVVGKYLWINNWNFHCYEFNYGVNIWGKTETNCMNVCLGKKDRNSAQTLSLFIITLCNLSWIFSHL